jgi:hypothetical protein
MAMLAGNRMINILFQNRCRRDNFLNFAIFPVNRAELFKVKDEPLTSECVLQVVIRE